MSQRLSLDAGHVSCAIPLQSITGLHSVAWKGSAATCILGCYKFEGFYADMSAVLVLVRLDDISGIMYIAPYYGYSSTSGHCQHRVRDLQPRAPALMLSVACSMRSRSLPCQSHCTGHMGSRLARRPSQRTRLPPQALWQLLTNQASWALCCPIHLGNCPLGS